MKDLGTHPALILRNHGLLTVGETASEAFLRMFYLEKACDIQIAAQASGSLRLPSPELAEYTARQFAGEVKDEFSDDQAYELAWAALLRLPRSNRSGIQELRRAPLRTPVRLQRPPGTFPSAPQRR